MACILLVSLAINTGYTARKLTIQLLCFLSLAFRNINTHTQFERARDTHTRWIIIATVDACIDERGRYNILGCGVKS